MLIKYVSTRDNRDYFKAKIYINSVPRVFNVILEHGVIRRPQDTSGEYQVSPRWLDHLAQINKATVEEA